MKKLTVLVITLSFLLVGCFSQSSMVRHKCETKIELVEALKKEYVDVPILILDLTGFDSINHIELRDTKDKKFYAYGYSVSHGPFTGGVNLSSEHDLGMDSGSLFAGFEHIDDEFSYKNMVIRTSMHDNSYQNSTAIRYTVSFAFDYKGIYYYGNAHYNKTDLTYEKLSIENIVVMVKAWYDTNILSI